MQEIKCLLKDNDGNLLAKAALAQHNDSEAVFELENEYLSRIEEDGVFDSGRNISVEIFDIKRGVLPYSCDIARVRGDRVFVRSFREKQNAERRGDLRIYVDFDAYIIVPANDGSGKSSFYKFPVHINNISAGGIGFVSEKNIDKELVCSFAFSHNKFPIVIDFKILRKIKNADDKYEYGCSFVGIDSAEEQIIREWVFDRQLSHL